MARFVDPLVVGRVIGEVVDLFVPSVSMTVAYGPKDISNGCLLKPSATAAPPLVRISGRRDDLYTLVYICWHLSARSVPPVDMHGWIAQLAACRRS
jgi:hypothetical protein